MRRRPTADWESAKARPADLIREVFEALGQYPLRTLLTSVGVLLGVATLVAAVGLGSTASAQVQSEFDAVRATEITVQPATDGAGGADSPGFSVGQVQAVAALPGVESAGVLYVRQRAAPASGSSTFAGSDNVRLPVVAASPGAFQFLKVDVYWGRTFEQVEADRMVAVIGADALGNLGLRMSNDAVSIYVNGRRLTVVGVVGNFGRMRALEGALFVPPSTARLIGSVSQEPPTLAVSSELGATRIVGEQLPLVLDAASPDRYAVTLPPDPQVLREGVTGQVSTLVLAVGGITLLLGLIGIANAQLLSVIRRRWEIGLRRALGARNRDIVGQFLLESGLSALLGTVIGSTVGLMVTVGVSLLRGWSPHIPAWVLLGAPPFGVLLGAAAGAYPALKASRVAPLRALREG